MAHRQPLARLVRIVCQTDRGAAATLADGAVRLARPAAQPGQTRPGLPRCRLDDHGGAWGLSLAAFSPAPHPASHALWLPDEHPRQTAQFGSASGSSSGPVGLKLVRIGTGWACPCPGSVVLRLGYGLGLPLPW